MLETLVDGQNVGLAGSISWRASAGKSAPPPPMYYSSLLLYNKSLLRNIFESNLKSNENHDPFQSVSPWVSSFPFSLRIGSGVLALFWWLRHRGPLHCPAFDRSKRSKDRCHECSLTSGSYHSS